MTLVWLPVGPNYELLGRLFGPARSKARSNVQGVPDLLETIPAHRITRPVGRRAGPGALEDLLRQLPRLREVLDGEQLRGLSFADEVELAADADDALQDRDVETIDRPPEEMALAACPTSLASTRLLAPPRRAMRLARVGSVT